MSRSGHTMNPKSATKLTMSPADAAPTSTRHAPTATSRIVASDGSESRTASNDVRSMATWMLASRRRSACAANRADSDSSAPSAFTTITPSTLSCTTFDTSPMRLCACAAGPSVRRWYTTFSAVMAGNSNSATIPSTQSVANIQTVEITTRMTVPQAYGSGPSTCDDASASACT